MLEFLCCLCLTFTPWYKNMVVTLVHKRKDPLVRVVVSLWSINRIFYWFLFMKIQWRFPVIFVYGPIFTQHCGCDIFFHENRAIKTTSRWHKKRKFTWIPISSLAIQTASKIKKRFFNIGCGADKTRSQVHFMRFLCPQRTRYWIKMTFLHGTVIMPCPRS